MQQGHFFTKIAYVSISASFCGQIEYKNHEPALYYHEPYQTSTNHHHEGSSSRSTPFLQRHGSETFNELAMQSTNTFKVAKGPKVTIKDVPVPKAAPGQVVIKVVVSGSNPKVSLHLSFTRAKEFTIDGILVRTGNDPSILALSPTKEMTLRESSTRSERELRAMASRSETELLHSTSESRKMSWSTRKA